MKKKLGASANQKVLKNNTRNPRLLALRIKPQANCVKSLHFDNSAMPARNARNDLSLPGRFHPDIDCARMGLQAFDAGQAKDIRSLRAERIGGVMNDAAVL